MPENGTWEELRAAVESDIRADERKKMNQQIDVLLEAVGEALEEARNGIGEIRRQLALVAGTASKPQRSPTVANEEQITSVRVYLEGAIGPRTAKIVAADLAMGLHFAASALNQLVERGEAENMGRQGYRLKPQSQEGTDRA
jgi:hypothetical protein